MKILNFNSTKITAKGVLTEITNDGFVFEGKDGTEILTFDVINEYFKDNEIKMELVKNEKFKNDV